MDNEINSKIFKRSVTYTASFVALLWLIKVYEWASGVDFGYLGIYPLTLKGTIGIFTSPLIHGDPFHLLSNTFPLILLGVGLFYFYSRIAKKVFLWIYLLSGVGVWFIAREAYHIGASGVVYGLVSFMFFIGLFSRNNKSMVVSLIILFLYGGMAEGLFPSNYRISYESHIMGALSGMFVAFLFRNQQMDEAEQKLEEMDEETIEQEYPHFSKPNHTHDSESIDLHIRYKQDNEHKK